MKPTIGRIVHYYSARIPGTQPLPAIIVSTYDDQRVDLDVFGQIPFAGYESNVNHKDHKGDDDQHYWDWPPVQGQYKKLKEIEPVAPPEFLPE